MREFTILEMLQNGVHFGHQQSRRHPKMESSIFTTRNGVSIINLERTKEALVRAANFLQDVIAGGGNALFVGTKRQARSIVQAAAQQAGQPYIVERWIGGLFTNFTNVKQLLEKLRRLKEERATGDWNKYTKKEQLDLQNELDRLDHLVGGLGVMEELPKTVFIVDLKADKTALAEAKKMRIPVIALCDTNVNPSAVDYPIPANDDATKSIAFVANALVEAVEAGRQAHELKLRQIAQAAAAASADAPNA